MKLIDMNAGQLCDTLLLLADPISKICEDQSLYKAMEEYRIRLQEKAPALIAGAKLLADIVPLLLKTHREETAAILSAIEGKPVDQILKTNGSALVSSILRAWKKEIRPFFTQCGALE